MNVFNLITAALVIVNVILASRNVKIAWANPSKISAEKMFVLRAGEMVSISICVVGVAMYNFFNAGLFLILAVLFFWELKQYEKARQSLNTTPARELGN